MTFTYKIFIFVRKTYCMDKKLTLSLDQEVIDEAKVYAKTHGTSLSKLVENYLETLTIKGKEVNTIETTPLVESLCGIIELPDSFDYKSEIRDYLSEKYK